MSVETIIKTEKETEEYVESKLSDARIQRMLTQQTTMQNQLDHYDKVKGRWIIADNILTIGGTLISLACVVVTTVTAGLNLPSLVSIIAGSITGSEILITASLVKGLTKPKVKTYSDRCALIRTYMNKVYVLSERSRNDNKISIEEIEEFNKLIDEYNLALFNNVTTTSIPTVSQTISI
jgi:hypothetical protein